MYFFLSSTNIRLREISRPLAYSQKLLPLKLKHLRPLAVGADGAACGVGRATWRRAETTGKMNCRRLTYELFSGDYSLNVLELFIQGT
jgi:hypothetical protein